MPDGIPYKVGAENVFAGKGDFYVLPYGDYLIAMNLTADRAFELDVPADFATARDLVRPSVAPGGAGQRTVGPRSTVILRRGE